MSENFEPTSSADQAEVSPEIQPEAQPVTTPDEAVTPDNTTTSDEATPAPENALPPEAQGETNGGPLGCCLGVMVGMLLSLSLVLLARFYIDPLGQLFQQNYALIGLLVRILMGILIFVFSIALGIVGWKLGRRFYREYESPAPRVKKNRSRPKKA